MFVKQKQINSYTVINNDNYEGYLMRYADGELNDEEVAMVEAFLAAHPELAEELEAITAPCLKITAPPVAMPDKEALMRPVVASITHRAIWRTLAAAIALLIAFGIVLKMGRHQEIPVIAQNNVTNPFSVSDTPLPDSLYIGRGKPAPLLLAKQHKANVLVAETKTPLQDCSLEAGSDDAKQRIAVDTTAAIIVEPLLADNTVADNGDLHCVATGCQDNSTVGRATNMIVIETDQLVKLTPRPNDRHGLRVGNVIENNNIALAEEKGLVGKAIDAVTRFLMRHKENGNEATLAFSD